MTSASPSSNSSPSHPSSRASGRASQTAKLHSAPTSSDLVFYGQSFCPFAHRIWIALEIKQIPYQYVEVVPEYMPGGSTDRPEGLLEVNPQGQVPCLRHGNWGVWESGVLMEYVSSDFSSPSGS